jgi:hypothetical protein
MNHSITSVKRNGQLADLVSLVNQHVFGKKGVEEGTAIADIDPRIHDNRTSLSEFDGHEEVVDNEEETD